MRKFYTFIAAAILSSIISIQAQDNTYNWGTNFFYDDWDPISNSDMDPYNNWAGVITASKSGFDMRLIINQTEWWDNCAMTFDKFEGFTPIDISNHPWVKMRIKLLEATWEDDMGGSFEHDSVLISLRIQDDTGTDLSGGQSYKIPTDSAYHEYFFDYSALDKSGDATKFQKLILTPIYQPGQYKDLNLLIDYIWVGDTTIDKAYLDSLKIDGEMVANFDPKTYTYEVSLDAGTTEIPVVTFATTDPEAATVKTSATSLNSANAADRTTNIEVTSQDGYTILNYKVVFNLPTSVNDAFINTQIYPNPTNNMLFIQSSNQIYSVELFDITGKSVLQKNTMGSQNTQINVSELPQGLYFITLRDMQNQTKTQKIIIK